MGYSFGANLKLLPLASQVRMGDEDDYVCEVNLKDAPISITHHLEVLGERLDGKKSCEQCPIQENFFKSKPV